MRELIAGSRLYAVDETVSTRQFFLEWLRLIDSDTPSLKLRSFLQRTDRWLRRHRRRPPPISHGNWRQYSNPDAILLRKKEDKEGGRRIVSCGSRAKGRTHDAPSYPLKGYVGNVPITGHLHDGWLTWTEAIQYGVGSKLAFHECTHSWERPISDVYPHMGLIPSKVKTTLDGPAGYSQPRAASVAVEIREISPVRTQSWGTRKVAPTQAQVDYARRMALASMYGGNPTTRPNFLRALLELKDTRQTVRGLVHFYRWAKSLMSHGALYERTLKGLRRVSVASATLAELAGAYLNYVFGLRPTAQDVAEFIRHVTNLGLDSFRPQGKTARPGLVIVSHYHVKPKFEMVRGRQPWGWRSFNIWTGPSGHGEDVNYGANGGPSPSDQRDQDVLETVVDGCVFARIKSDASQYFWDHFGEVGYTWSWPPILTAWELLPWSWLVDWFSQTKESIRLAERETRVYWMRAGFEDPWYAEKHTVYRHCHSVSLTHTAESNLIKHWDGGWAWTTVRLNSYWSIALADVHRVSMSFSRQPLEVGFPNVESDASRITVRAFQISVGMALVLNS